MNTFKGISYLLLLLLFVLAGCDSPVQTEQKLGSWYNDENVVSGVGDILDIACSPVDESIVFSRRQQSMNLVAFDFQGNAQDTLYKVPSSQYERVRYCKVSSTNKMAVLYEDGILRITDLNTQSFKSSYFENSYIYAMQWSLDGQKLYLLNNLDYDLYHIIVLDDQGNKIAETEVQGLRLYHDFSISPDGSTMLTYAYIYENSNDTRGIYKINVETGEYELFIKSSYANTPAISPDSERLAYWAVNDTTRIQSIVLADKDGNTIETVVDTLGSIVHLEFTLDGKKLLFLGQPHSSVTGFERGWYAYDFDSKALSFLNLDFNDHYYAGFGQDGETLLKYYYGEIYNICTVDQDSNVVSVTDFTEYVQYDPVFTPDGSEILFVYRSEFYKVPVSGGEWTPFLHDAQTYISSKYNPVISPDGHYLAYEYQYGTIIYDLEQNQALYSIADGKNPTWSPNSDEIACVVEPDSYSGNEVDQVVICYLWEDHLGQERKYDIGEIYDIDWINASSSFPYQILITCGRDEHDNYSLYVLDEWEGKVDRLLSSVNGPLLARWSAINQEVVFKRGTYTIERRRILEDF